MSQQDLTVLRRAAVAIALLVSFLQAVLFAGQPQKLYGALGVGLAIATIVVASRRIVTNADRNIGTLIFLCCLQSGLFVMHLASSQPPWSFRLLTVAIALVYLAMALSMVLVSARVLTSNAILLAFSVATGGFITEAALELQAPSQDMKSTTPIPEYSWRMDPHPTLGQINPPYSHMATYYPGNPRNYFKQEDIEAVMWRLEVHDANEATFLRPHGNQKQEVLRVEITKAGTQTNGHIQLNQTNLKLVSQHRYKLTFRGRADNTRNASVGLTRAHEPWTDLGLYRSVLLRPDWQSFEEEFVATADDDNAKIIFDLGGSAISAEFSDVSLLSLEDGQLVRPNVKARYSVEYDFNALGCRDRDYAIPRQPGVFRILLLGDSFTLGIGVHEEHTVAKQLERMLGQNKQRLGRFRSYEVINCGATGYDTRAERLFYELIGSKYQPNLVLVLMVWNDDMSWTEELDHGYAMRQRSKLESLFYIAGKVQDYRYRRPPSDFSRSVEEILRLDTEVRANGARLGVVIFRVDSDYAGTTPYGQLWNRLTETVVSGLKNKDIPILDLGKALCPTPCEQLADYPPPSSWHPNEIAHAVAAQEILSFLQKAFKSDNVRLTARART